MPNMIRSRLFMRMFLLYASMAMFGVVIITLHNLYTNRLPMREFFQNFFFIKLMLGVLCVLVLQTYSEWRLRYVSRYLRSQGGEGERSAAWQSLIAFPSEIFRAMIAFGLIVSPAYHLLVGAGTNLYDLYAQESRLLLENLLFDQALSLTLAVVLYIGLSRITRRYIVRLSGDFLMTRSSSAVTSLLVTFTALYLVAMFSMLWYSMNTVTAGQEVKLSVLAGIGAACLLLTTWVFARGVLDFQDRIQAMIVRIRQILQQAHGLEHERIPIVSADETGKLASAINRLQRHIAEEFEGVQRELSLAHQVQMKMLPAPYAEKDALTIAAVYRLTKDVGGDFYDIIDIDDTSTAVVIGDVSGKGMQAALIMSATMGLLRSEIRRGGDAAQILTRLNKELSGTLGTSSFVTLFVAVIDRKRFQADYASAGHLSPYLLSSGSLKELECSSLPLGIDPDEIYFGSRIQLNRGDRIILFTDGVVEARAPDGNMLGFENFARILQQIPEDADPREALDGLVSRLPWETSSAYEDDRTLVLVQL